MKQQKKRVCLGLLTHPLRNIKASLLHLEDWLLLHQFINLARRLPSQHFEFEVLAGYDALASENLLHGLSCQLGMIVFLAEVAEPYMAETRRGIIGKCLSARHIAQVAVGTQDAILEILRIRSLQEHLLTMVRLYHQIVGATDEIVHLLGDVAHIGDEAERHPLTLHEIAHVVSAVVGNPERSNLELAHIQRHTLLDDVHKIGRNFLSDAVVALDTYMNFTGCIYWQMIVGAEASHRLHMVGMVVRDEDVVHILKSQSIVVEMLFQRSDTHSNVYQYRIRLSVKIVTVATTSTAKLYKSKHFNCYFDAKLTKKILITKFFIIFVRKISK